MKHPVWILNSFLIAIIFFALLFIFFSRQQIPKRTVMEPPENGRPLKESALKINLKKIYEDDLFDTYEKKFEFPEEETHVVEPLPRPPRPKMAAMPPEPKPTFFDPLNIALKGITVFGNNPAKNRAIIADNKTNAERVYREGDTLEDAQLLRILNTKIIFLRSNGQQEVLYLREQDAHNDPAYKMKTDWDEIIQKKDSGHYYINPITFGNRIKNLAHLIDMLDITTVYKKGKSIGVRIGKVEDPAFATKLGLETGDIIVDVAGLSTVSKTSRLEIYKKIIQMQESDTITLTVTRQNAPITLSYTLKKFSENTITPTEKPSADEPKISSQALREEQKKLLEKKHSFAPTMQEIRAREKQDMLRIGKQKTNPPITE